MKRKNPYLAGLLNFIPGLGYLYLGKRKVFGWILLATMIISQLIDISYLDLNRTNIMGIVIIYFLWFFAFAYDAFSEAKSLNKEAK